MTVQNNKFPCVPADFRIDYFWSKFDVKRMRKKKTIKRATSHLPTFCYEKTIRPDFYVFAFLTALFDPIDKLYFFLVKLYCKLGFNQ